MENLAILGGNPISNKMLFKNSPLGKEEKNSMLKAFSSGVLSKAGQGKWVKKFEANFANFHKVRYALATTSGTTALHTAISALGIKHGSEVLVTALTFVSSASVILQEHLVPVFVDIDPHNFCIDIKDLEKKITKRTKALVIVHLYGRSAEMDQLMYIAKKYNLSVIEDCAQAHGAKYRGKYIGTFGDIACFSFYQTKNMICGEGGMIITNNKKLFETCFIVANHGLIGELKDYNYDRLGYNYHLTEIQAAIGIEQLKKLKHFNIQRRENADLYKNLLKDTSLVFQDNPDYVYHVYYSLTALLPKKFAKYRDWFIAALRAENVEINRLYPVPLHKTDLFLNSNSKCPVAEDVTSRLFNFYTNPGISKKYMELTCKAVKKVLTHMENNYGR